MQVVVEPERQLRIITNGKLHNLQFFVLAPLDEFIIREVAG